jgi:hypothetical protein
VALLAAEEFLAVVAEPSRHRFAHGPPTFSDFGDMVLPYIEEVLRQGAEALGRASRFGLDYQRPTE